MLRAIWTSYGVNTTLRRMEKKTNCICLSSVPSIHCVSPQICHHPVVQSYIIYETSFMYVFLASKLLIQIIKILREEKRLKKHHLELLITQQLTELDLSREGDEIAGPLRLASIRCSVRPQFSIIKVNCTFILNGNFEFYRYLKL